MTPKELVISHVKLWKTFYLAGIIPLHVKTLLFFSQFILPPSFLTVTQSIFAHHFALFTSAFAFSLWYNSQTLFLKRSLGQYIMDYSLANWFFRCLGYNRNCHWNSLAKTFILCLHINSLSNPDPGVSMDKWREVKSREGRLLIGVSISTLLNPIYLRVL